MADKIIVEIVIDDKKAVKSIRQFKGKSKKAAAAAGDGIGAELVSGIKGQFAAFGVTIIAALGIKKITEANIQFGKSLAEIRTISKGLGLDQKELRNQLIQTSAQFGTSAAAQAQAFYQVISAGITDSVEANELLVAANKLAIGGLTSTAQSIDILTTAVNAFQGQNLTATRAADILFGTVRLGKTRVDELASSLGQVLPTAAALGVSFEDVAGGLAQLTTRGISTSEAVTQLNAIFTAVLKKQDAARKLGPEVAKAFTLQALQAKGLTDFLKDLNVALGGSEERLVKLTGRAEAARAVITLAADNFVGLGRNIQALAESTGAADDAFNEMSQTLDFKLNQAGAKTQAVFLKLSGSSTLLRGSLDFLNTELDDILQAFDSLGEIDLIIGAVVTNVLIEINRLGVGIATLLTGPLAILFPGLAIGAFFAIDSLKANVTSLEESLANVAISTGESSDVVKNNLKGVADEAENTEKKVVKSLTKIDKAFQSSLRVGISQSVQALGAALVGAEGGFQKFANVVLGVIGDMAINLGTTLIALGIGIDALKASLLAFGGGAAIAAGIALIAIGGALKSLAGGAIAAPVGGGGVTAPTAGEKAPTGGVKGPFVPGGEGEEEEEFETRGPKTEVTIIVQGDILDRRETGLALIEVINESISTNGTEVSFA